MRVNVYAEELTQRIEIVEKQTKDGRFTGLRIYLYMPVTLGAEPSGPRVKGPFLHNEGDDDSSAITFWGKHDLRKILVGMIEALDKHHQAKQLTNQNQVEVGMAPINEEPPLYCPHGRAWSTECHQKPCNRPGRPV